MYFLYILLLFHFTSSSGVIPTIYIDIKNTRLRNKYTSSVNTSTGILYLGEKFGLQVNTDNAEIEPMITCKIFRRQTILFNKSLTPCIEKKNCYIYDQNKATSAMSASWVCQFTITKGKEYFTNPFDVQVRLPYTGIFYVNGKETPSDRNSTNYYDNIAHYQYVDGEMVNFECKMIGGNNISMVYHDKDNQIEIPKKKGSSKVYLKLNKSQKPDYLNCILTEVDTINTKNYYIRNTLRIDLYAGTLDYPTFKINELVLTTNKNVEEADELKFNYDYYDNERIILQTVLDSNKYNGSECVTDDETVNKILHEFLKPNTVINLNVPLTLDETFDGLKLKCMLTMAYNEVLKDGNKLSRIILEFNHIESTGLKPSLYGFSWANVLAKYEYLDKYEHNIALIKYSYRENELILTCTAEENGIRWSFNTDQVENLTLEEEHKDEITSSILMKESFKLKPNCNRTLISCYKDSYGNTTIELIRDGPPLFDDIPATSTITEVKLPVIPDPVKKRFNTKLTTLHQPNNSKTYTSTVNITNNFLKEIIKDEENTNSKNIGYNKNPDTTLFTTNGTLNNPKKTKITMHEVLPIETTSRAPIIKHNLNTTKTTNGKSDKNNGTKNNFTLSTERDVAAFGNNNTNKKLLNAEDPPNRENVANPKTDVKLKPDKTTKHNTNSSPDTDVKPGSVAVPDTFGANSAIVNQSNDDGYNVPEKGVDWKLMAIIMGIILIAIIVTLITVCLFKVCKRNKQERESHNIVDYENLPEHNEGPMPIPRQWETNDDITYATVNQINTDLLYAKPLPKNMRNKNDNVYSEVIDYKRDPTYCNTGRNVKKNRVEDGNKELNYANISGLKNGGGDTYAEVVPKSERKSEVAYNNISTNYNDDYVEPAYAEINKH